MAGRILLVDDMPEELESLRFMIAEAHPEYSIATAGSVSEALDLIGQQGEPFDVVMTDMRMPGGEEGLSVVEAARKKDPLTEIIVLTAYGDLDNVCKALEQGANQYIDKNMSRSNEVRRIVVEKRMEQVQQLRRAVQEIENMPTVQEAISQIQSEALVQYLRGVLSRNPDVGDQLKLTRDRLERLPEILREMQEHVDKALQTIEPILEAFSDLGKQGEG